MYQIDAKGVYYKELNEMVRQAIKEGHKEIELLNINGQRYIGDGLKSEDVRIIVNGVPGQDLAAFMSGPEIIVNANAQDGIANTMSGGKVVVKGLCGDVLGYGMRSGKLHIKGDVGYRVGIHMKSFKDEHPVIIIGGKAGDFLGEYMAGGIILLLGLGEPDERPLSGNYIGSGMHNGTIYIRGKVEEYQLGREVGIVPMDEADDKLLKHLIDEYASDMGMDANEILSHEFIKLKATSLRPYGNLYAY